MFKLNLTKITFSLLIAIILSQFLHELTHAFFGLIVGSKGLQVHFFAANALQQIPSDQIFKIILVEGSAALVNILVGLFAFLIFTKTKTTSIWLKYTAFLTTIFSFCLGFGYLMFDGIFYTPGGPGDFKAILNLFNGNIFLRIFLILIGSLGWFWTLFFTAKGAWQFILEENQKVKINLKINYLILSLFTITQNLAIHKEINFLFKLNS